MEAKKREKRWDTARLIKKNGAHRWFVGSTVGRTDTATYSGKNGHSRRSHSGPGGGRKHTKKNFWLGESECGSNRKPFLTSMKRVQSIKKNTGWKKKKVWGRNLEVEGEQAEDGTRGAQNNFVALGGGRFQQRAKKKSGGGENWEKGGKTGKSGVLCNVPQGLKKKGP